MSLTAQIQGIAQVRRLAAAVKATGDKGLGREMSAALRKTAKPIEVSVRREADAAMPASGGYQALLSKSLRFRASARSGTRTATLKLKTFADGTNERRDIRALEKGQLRHPVYGRSRTVRGRGRVPNPWAVTVIRAGFHRRGTENAGDEAARELGKVLDDFAARLAKG